MKNLIFSATLLIFMLNISDNVISAEAKDELPDPVLDVDGNELKTGDDYYINSFFRPGGGVTIYPQTNKTCTYGVAQLVFGKGLPVTFANNATDLGEVVRESTDLTIAFSPGILFCPTQWKVDEYDEASGQTFVTAGEFDVNETSNKWFQIRKDSSVNGTYRFFFCPKVCEFCVQFCTNVGVYVYEGVRRFALGGNFPSLFTFSKFPPCPNTNVLEA